MIRNILAFFIGFVVTYAGVTAAFIFAQMVMGPEVVFAPGSWRASAMFINVTAVTAFIAAVAGGAACQFVADRRTPALVLAALVLVAGLAMAIPTLISEAAEAPPRPENPTQEQIGEAQEKGWIREPTWLLIANPLIGAAGILLGAVLVPKRRSNEPIRRIPESEAETSEAERKAPAE